MSSLTLLVTANCGGDLDYFPRLQTAIQNVRRELGEQKTLIIDSGLAWSDDEHICRITGNRAPYIILDGMGYHAAFVDGLSPQDLARVTDQTLIRLVPPGFAWQGQALGQAMVVADPNVFAPLFDGERAFLLPLPRKYHILQVELDLDALSITNVVEHRFLLNTPPDPGINGVIDFVKAEARYYEKQKQQDN